MRENAKTYIIDNAGMQIKMRNEFQFLTHEEECIFIKTLLGHDPALRKRKISQETFEPSKRVCFPSTNEDFHDPDWGEDWQFLNSDDDAAENLETEQNCQEQLGEKFEKLEHEIANNKKAIAQVEKETETFTKQITDLKNELVTSRMAQETLERKMMVVEEREALMNQVSNFSNCPALSPTEKNLFSREDLIFPDVPLPSRTESQDEDKKSKTQRRNPVSMCGRRKSRLRKKLFPLSGDQSNPTCQEQASEQPGKLQHCEPVPVELKKKQQCHSQRKKSRSKSKKKEKHRLYCSHCKEEFFSKATFRVKFQHHLVNHRCYDNTRMQYVVGVRHRRCAWNCDPEIGCVRFVAPT